MHALKFWAIGVLLSGGVMMGNTAFATPTPDVIQQGQLPAFADPAFAIKYALQYKHYANITPHIHPKKGVRFSMYAYVDVKKDKVFSQRDFDNYLQQAKIKFTWGDKDGIGEPLITSLPAYLSNWVVRRDGFANASVIINQFYGTGNSLNNLLEAYPNHDFVEFYYAGNDKYNGMDWRCLRLVFETYQGRPYLVAIITDEWTI